MSEVMSEIMSEVEMQPNSMKGRRLFYSADRDRTNECPR